MGVCGTVCWTLIVTFFVGAGGALEAKTLQSTQTVTKRGQTWSTFRLTNGLRVLLISDARFQKASAAMVVPVGSWSDPKGQEGLAHYLEHMLFLGTQDFPRAGEFDEYLSTNGGYSNAYTARDHTNYFFEVNSSAYSGGLHRFSQFFVSPTFDAAFVEREKNAVHNEFATNLKNENWRYDHILSIAGTEGHPGQRFLIGSKETLRDVTPDTLTQFYQRHYSSSTMRLVIMSPHSIAEQKALVEQYFTEVPNRNRKPADYSRLPHLLKPGQWIEIQSLKEMHRLTLSFAIPPSWTGWKTKVFSLIAEILGDESRGSIVAALKRENLITNQGMSLNDYGTSGIMSVSFDLTAAGARDPEKIVERFFAYIHRVRDERLQPYTFSETQAVAKLKFESRGVQEGGGVAAGLASDFLRFETLELEEQKLLFHEMPSAEEVDGAFATLAAENVAVYHQYPEAEVSAEEPYFGVKYGIRRLSKEWTKRMNAAQDPRLTYPAPNPYIPTNFTLLKDDSQTAPYMIVNDSRGTFWFHQEKRDIAQPKGFATFSVQMDEIANSPKQKLAAMVYAKLLEKSWNETGYPMRVAGYMYDVIATGNGLSFTFQGSSQSLLGNIDKLLSISFGRLDSNAEDLAVVKKHLQDKFNNRRTETAFTIAVEHFRALSLTPHLLEDEVAPFLETISLADIREFERTALKHIRVKGLAYGNLRAAEVRPLVEKIFTRLDASPLASGEHVQVRSRIPNPGQREVKLLRGDNNNNAFFTVFYSGPRTPRNGALTTLVQRLISSAYYTEMRSKQQLGYRASSIDATQYDSSGLAFGIQSGDYGATELSRRSNTYIQELVREVSAINPSQLEEIKASVVEELSRERNDMPEEFAYLTRVVGQMNSEFDFNSRVIAELKILTVEDVREFLTRTFAPESQARLSVYYTGVGFPDAVPLADEKPRTH